MAESAPIMSPGASTPSGPSSPTSEVFSVSHFQRRDSESTTSTAPSSVESANTTSEPEAPKQQDLPSSETRPILNPAKTAPAIPTLNLNLSNLSPPTVNAESSTAKSTPTTPSTTSALKHDPLTRAFPKPTTTATVEELLARNPGGWSLNHWIKHGAESRAPAVDKEAEARRFAEAKAALLKAHWEMGGGRFGAGADAKSGTAESGW